MQEVVADLLVGKSLESLGDIYPMVVDGLCRYVFGGVLAGFVGVKAKRESPVVLLDRLLIGILFCESAIVLRAHGFGSSRRTLETPSTSYGSQMSGVVRAVTIIR